MSVELPPSTLECHQNFTVCNPSNDPNTTGRGAKLGRIAATFALVNGLMLTQETIGPAPAMADVVTATVGMPFEGKWAYSNEIQATCGSASNQTSHPSCHENYSGDWSTDLYAAPATKVKLNVSSSASLTFSWDTAASGTCGETRRINVLAGGVAIGKLHVTHLSNAASTETAPTNGMVIGQVANLTCNPGGTGKHIHMELKNAASPNTYSCYTNHSNANAAAGMLLPEGISLGQLGSSNTGSRQACATPNASPPASDPVPAVIQRPNGETGLVVVAPDQTLDYYFNSPGSSMWYRLDIPGSDAKSMPAAVLRPSGELNIVAQGVDGSLDFYINSPGTNTWHKIEVAGNDSAQSAPSVIQRPSGETNIVVQGPNNSLDFYYNPPGSPIWGKVTVPGGQAYSKPAIVQRGSGETNIAVLGPNNSMDFYYNAQGSPNWGKIPVAVGGWALSAPSMIQRSMGETDIAIQGPNHSLDVYINTPGSPQWGRIRAAGDGTTYNDANPPAMLLRPSGELNVAVHGPGNQVDFYYNQQGSPNWGRTLVAVGGYAFREPVMIQRPTTGETDLVIVGPGNRLDFYMNTQGSPLWGVLSVSGNNSAY